MKYLKIQNGEVIKKTVGISMKDIQLECIYPGVFTQIILMKSKSLNLDFHVTSLEELSMNPETTLNEIYDFMNIKYPKNIELKIHNSGGYEKSNKLQYRKSKEFYTPFNEKFFNIVGKKFNWS